MDPDNCTNADDTILTATTQGLLVCRNVLEQIGPQSASFSFHTCPPVHEAANPLPPSTVPKSYPKSASFHLSSGTFSLWWSDIKVTWIDRTGRLGGPFRRKKAGVAWDEEEIRLILGMRESPQTHFCLVKKVLHIRTRREKRRTTRSHSTFVRKKGAVVCWSTLLGKKGAVGLPRNKRKNGRRNIGNPQSQ